MKKNIKCSPLVPFTSWKAALLMGLIGSCAGYSFAMGEVAIATGYRQDSSSFSICSGLAAPEYYGFGKVRSRDVHIWEIGIGASLSVTDHAYLRSALSYGVILGGKVSDSGVADINSNPLNSVLGHYYTGCCSPCECPENTCACDCQDKVLRETVQATANLGGNVVDFNIALGYAFRPMDDFMLSPVIGWSYNSQRQRWRDAIYGPLQMEYGGIPCAEIANFFEPDQGTPAYFELTDSLEYPDVRLTGGESCISFGHCFDGTVYRARWNGPFIGVDLGYAFSDVWNVAVGYALSYAHYSGKFETFTSATNEGCNCDECPVFSNQFEEGITSPSYAFVPSEMSFSSWGLGQEVSIATDYRCCNWKAGIGIGYAYRNATHCSDSEPCTSCETVANPSQAVTAGNKQYPVWSYAQLTKARWGSFSALVTLGYDF